MPIIQITILPQTKEKKAEISRVLTDEMHKMTGITKDAFVIVFNEVPADNIADGGELLSDLFLKRGK